MAEPDDSQVIPTKANLSPEEAEGIQSVQGITDSAVVRMFGAARGRGGPGAWAPPTPEELQCELPQFEIFDLLGRGGMGAVYKGRQRSLDRYVAIKILPGAFASGDPEYAVRFQREARAMARLSHPCIVAVHDASETSGGLLYFVMDYIQGTDVQQLVAAQGRLPVERALAIASSVCDALDYAHRHGVIHRDIKPSNVMVDTAGQVKVADFGLAKLATNDSALLTASDAMMGTPDFMAPESHLGTAQVDHRADLYAIGVMLYQMLTGKLPRGRFEPPSRLVPGLDRRLDAIIDRTLQNERDARYSSALELRTALAPVLTRSLALTSASPRSWKKPALFGALAVLLAGAAFIVFRPSTPEVKPVPPAAETPKLAGASAPAAGTTPQWQRFEFAKMPVLEATQSRKNVSMQGDLLHVHDSDGWTYERERRLAVTNAALRAVIDWSTPARNPKLLFRETRDQPGRHCYAKLARESVEVGIHRGGDQTLKRLPHGLATQTPREVIFQAALIGTRMTVWLNGQRLGEVDGLPADPTGTAGLQASDALFRSLEILNLDGLPEAEALKLAGITGDAGKSLTTPKPTDTKVSATFPPGEWVQPYPDPLKIPNLADFTDGWARLTTQGAYLYPRPSGWPSYYIRNGGIRARFGESTAENEFKYLQIRNSQRPGEKSRVFELHIKTTEPAMISLREHRGEWVPANPSEAQKWAAHRLLAQKAISPLTGEFTAEFIAVGPTLFARVYEHTLTWTLADDDGRLGSCGLAGTTGKRFRDVEILNLDGLPEAEALKLLGLEKP